MNHRMKIDSELIEDGKLQSGIHTPLGPRTAPYHLVLGPTGFDAWIPGFNSIMYVKWTSSSQICSTQICLFSNFLSSFIVGHLIEVYSQVIHNALL